MDKYVVFDVETSGLNYWEPDFRLVSASFVDQDGSAVFTFGEDETRAVLLELSYSRLPILVYNLGFELGVTRCRFPGIELNYALDVARLVQLHDSGGDGAGQGFGLKRSVKRILNKIDDYTDEAYSWIRENVPEARRGKEGAHLSKLPRDILERYNHGDTYYTRELYLKLTQEFRKIDYDYSLDHELYLNCVSLIVDAKIRGIKVDREQLQKDLIEMETEVALIDAQFFEMVADEVDSVRNRLFDKAQAKFKKKVLTEIPPFNITSKKQLEMLFVDELGLNSGFKTAKGSPSFKSSHMGLWGKPGKLLERRGKKLNHINQVKALLDLSEKDGRFHPGLKAVSTRSGRLAGGN